MKPLNLDNRPCSPISSNCVIWQGPDIPCIKLCTGDTISDVIFKLATELCTIMDQLKVSNYDLSCLNLSACPPEDFQALIQLLINKICELNGIPVDDGKSSGCPDCVVSVAPCLVENGQTTMQLIDYVQMIANKLCSLISEIESINEQIGIINTTLVDLQFQIDNLPVYTLPSIQMDCILSGVQPLDAAVNALINNPLGYCALLSSTGTPTDINTAVLSQCITDIDQPLAALPAVNTFSAYYSGSWVNAVALGAAPTVSNAIKNIWVAICDIYNYVSNFPTTVVAAGTNTTVTSSTVGSVTTYTVSCECGAGGLTLTEPCPCGSGLPTNADIYAYIDTTSGPYNDGNACFTQNRLVLVQSVKQWYDDYQLANPSYTGNLYVFILPAEKYLSYPRGIIQGNIPSAQFLNLTTALVDPLAQPPNWGNAISWVPPTELLYIAFVNESNPWYHGSTFPGSFTGQPTATDWTVDYNDFVADYTNHWTFFRGVIYPAVDSSTGANLCLQAFGALNNIASITSADLTPALGPTNMGYLGSPAYPLTNPYVTSNEGLWDYNWYGILDKSVVPGPCPQLSFTAKEFGEDLNAILGGGGGGGCDCVSLVDSWDPNSQTLALRSLTSCTLDLSVDEAGCISIESSGGAELTVEDTNTVNLIYNSGTLSAVVQDTGWVNLEGFSYMSSLPNSRPQCRRIGNQIIFRGVIQIPMGTLDEGADGTAIPVTGPDHYRNTPYGRTLNAALSSDPDACFINGAAPTGSIPSGSTDINKGITIYFNRAQSVIPTSVVPAGTSFGREMTLGNRQIVNRGVKATGRDVVLSTVLGVFADSTGRLAFTAPYSVENFNDDILLNTSMLRNIVSNIIANENVPKFEPTAPSANNAPAVGAYQADLVGATERWGFTQNCMSAFQLGGFSVRIDGLSLYIDPCTTTIPSPNPCLPPA